MQTGDWISLASVIMVFLGAVWAFIQWQHSIKLKKSEFILQFVKELRYDKEIVNTMYIIEYDPNWYNNDFHGGKDEYNVDKFLSLLNYICYMRKMKLLSENEFKVLRYEIRRTCISPSAQSYLWNLYHFSRKMSSPCSFEYLIDYGLGNNYFYPEFANPNSGRYKKLLNF
jgi:hypothetical protein